MPKLPVLSGKELIKALEKVGFTVIRQRGSHVMIRHEDGRIATIPNHKVVKRGTLKRGILNPLRISVEELSNLLKKK